MKDLNTMLKTMGLFVMSEAVDEVGENVFMLMDEKTEEIRAYRYTDIVNDYKKHLKKKFDF